MCAVCVEYQKGNLTRLEAERALNELINTDPKFNLGHLEDVHDLLEKDDGQ